MLYNHLSLVNSVYIECTETCKVFQPPKQNRGHIKNLGQSQGRDTFVKWYPTVPFSIPAGEIKYVHSLCMLNQSLTLIFCQQNKQLGKFHLEI